MAEVIERLSSIETTLSAIQTTLAAQNGWNEKTAQERTQHYTETIKELAIIKTTQNTEIQERKKYEDECSKERDAHGKKLQEHDTELKTTKAVAAWRAGFISTVISLAGVIATILAFKYK